MIKKTFIFLAKILLAYFEKVAKVLKSQKYNLIFKITILSIESYFLFIAFIDIYLMISIRKI